MENKKANIKGTRSQVTIFIIIAILIIAGIVIFFSYRSKITPNKVPLTFNPIYSSFLSCIEEDTLAGASILGTQAGYIYLPDFEPGSAYMPFSSQLDFYGNPVPYWYYVSGNNIQKEQIPSKSEIEKQLERFIDEQIVNCNLKLYEKEGFSIEKGSPKANVKINDKNIEINLDMDLNIKKDEDKISINSHKKTIKSNIGKLYKISSRIYDYEQDTLFLENYSVDILRNYAPVDGVEFSCKPETWIALNVSEKLKDAIEANTQALKVKGDYYDLKDKNNKYFIIPIEVSKGVSVNFLNSKYWPYAFEVSPAQGALLIANPVGNQAGLGILGFCYVPYHFVYDIKYPVLIQVIEGEEIFQFPVGVVIQGNLPRKPLENSEAVDKGDLSLCQYLNQEVEVKTYNTNLDLINSDISFTCLGDKCNIGEISNGELNAKFPQCVNGFIVAKSEGYETKQYQISTNTETSAKIILDKLYDVNIDLLLDKISTNKNAIVSFEGENGVKTISYPEQKTISLSQGLYNINVQIYDDSSLTIGAAKNEQCYEVSRGAIGGFFGLTKKECVEIEFPEQVVSQVLVGGGKIEYYISENELANSRTIEINSESLIKPESIEALNTNYILFEQKSLDVKLK